MMKKRIKTLGKWSEYKKLFKDKQMRFAFSDIAMIIDENISEDILVKAETSLIKETLTMEDFVQAGEIIGSGIKLKLNFKELGKFLWYAYNITKFWIRKEESIYKKDNNVEMNREKNIAWTNFLSSFDDTISDFNVIVKKIMKRIF